MRLSHETQCVCCCVVIVVVVVFAVVSVVVFSIYISDSKNAQFGQQHSAKAVTDCISDIEIRVTEI